MEAGEECDCGSVQVSGTVGLRCGPGLGRESTEWGARSRIRARPPFYFPPLLSGVQPGGWQLLQEMHPDSRRHVQRWALLSPLQGEKDPTSEGGGRARPGAKKRLDALDKRREGGGEDYRCGHGLSKRSINGAGMGGGG